MRHARSTLFVPALLTGALACTGYAVEAGAAVAV
jgi:hypothetical protein